MFPPEKKSPQLESEACDAASHRTASPEDPQLGCSSPLCQSSEACRKGLSPGASVSSSPSLVNGFSQ